MDYRIEKKPALVLTGYTRRFDGVPGNREEQEEKLFVNTRALQYMLKGLAEDSETQYTLIRDVDDNGYSFSIAAEVDVWQRENLSDDAVLGVEFAKYFENIAIPEQTYAVFQTEPCRYPTQTFLDLRRRIVSEWLPGSGFRLADAPELCVYRWYRKPRNMERVIEHWIPIEKQ